MKSVITLAGAILGLGLLAAPALGHHSTNNIYDESKTVQVTGVVKQWQLVNPHPYLIVEITGEDGQIRDWDISFGGSAAGPLRRRGYTVDTFTPGETINITGNPARAEGAYGVLVRGGMTRQDGTPIP